MAFRPLHLFALLLVAATLSAGLSGCGSLSTSSLSSIFRMPPEGRDPTEEETEDWNAVGREARGNRPLEKNTDPAWLDFRSSQAKSIERNLGIE